MAIKTYKDVKIDVIDQTRNTQYMLRKALDITMKKELSGLTGPEAVSKSTMKHLLKARHMSVLDHMSMSFFIEGVSRNLVMQLTRHRMAGYTVSSQHYQDYRGYDDVIKDKFDTRMTYHIDQNNKAYISLIDLHNIKPEEARQILPGSKSCTLMWTINADSLVNFLNMRLCRRNTAEMLNFAMDIHEHAINWWPELFWLVAPDCRMFGACNQGFMRCKDGKKEQG